MNSKYFSEYEQVCKCCGRGADVISPKLLMVLDAMRETVGGPVYVSNMYRCPDHNAEVGGVPNSQHVFGTAADVQLPAGWSVDNFAKLARDCVADGVGLYNWGCHVDVRGYRADWDERW